MKVPFWGCPGLNFKANLPFDGMRHAASSAERPAYAAFEKEIPLALQSMVGFFKTLKCYHFISFYKVIINEVFHVID
jgi:hypothetical protein